MFTTLRGSVTSGELAHEHEISGEQTRGELMTFFRWATLSS
jgi:hypothetical protein